MSTRKTAIDAFLAKKAEIDAMLERLVALSADHFNVHPDAVNYGHVGDLEHVAARLKDITDSQFREGEYAELAR